LYRELAVEQELFPFTRSCETDAHTTGHCGHCWWCKERLWAFGYLE
jgi:7-cyano-7-deazaguanine synthase in queuosine biosynthesis